MDVLGGNTDTLLYELEQFLINNNASDYLHYFLKSMYSRIISGEVIVILAPIDDALARLVDISGKSLEQIANSNEGINLLTNFLSSSSIQEIPPVYTAINGAYLERQENLDRLNYTAQLTFNIGNLFVATVDGIINMPGQLERLHQTNSVNITIPARSNIIGGNVVTGFDDLPNVLIRKITLELSLDDIISNCGISQYFNATLCDAENFWNEKLRKDYPKQRIINNSWKNTYRLARKRLYTFGLEQLTPKLVEELNSVIFVACGHNFTAAISGGQLYTYGIGKNGQLGHGNHDKQLKFKLVEGLDNVTMVACGGAHTAAISSGKLYTFGDGTVGQLGHDDDKSRSRPTLVEGLDNITFVACGHEYTAVISGGRLYTFGYNSSGQLGHGDYKVQRRPKIVEGLSNVTFIACGRDHMAAISKGRLYTFGAGRSGRLGHGDTLNQNRPALVGRLDNVTFVSCGNAHTGAISNGQLYTFGHNGGGQLGQGDLVDGFVPTLVDRSNSGKELDNVTVVACGTAHTSIISNDGLYTFGSGNFGRLGQGNKEDQLRPKLVEGLNDVSWVASGPIHVATIAN